MSCWQRLRRREQLERELAFAAGALVTTSASGRSEGTVTVLATPELGRLGARCLHSATATGRS